MKEIRILIEGMKCEHCAMNVKNEIMKLSNVKDVIVSLDGYADIKYDEQIDINLLKENIEDLGYKVIINE